MRRAKSGRARGEAERGAQTRAPARARSGRAQRRRRGWAALALWIAAAALAQRAQADPLPVPEVPEPLRPWVSWVLRELPEAGCPFAHGNPGERRCAFGDALALQIDADGARFEQRFTVFRDTWVALPGDARHWPEQVTVEGRAAAVLERGGAPSVRLAPGRSALRGRLRWQQRPELLRIPEAAGVVQLRIDGRSIPFPRIERAGELWLGAAAAQAAGESRVEVAVQRRLIDEIPLELETRIELRVSGPGRELQIAGVLPAGFVPGSLQSALPARVGVDGSLLVQIRPGAHALTIHARQEGSEVALGYPQVRGPWDPQETWVFEARPQLRSAELAGVPGVDPQQSDVPGEWRSLPAYLVEPGSRFELIERRRGDAEPNPDRLQLRRTLWLDFDGAAYTAQDRITGTLARSWRLQVAPGVRLGRAHLNGADQWITRLSPEAPDGVEVRAGQLRMQADSRIPRAGALASSGWSHEFESAGLQLRLPPGWRLLHAAGADQVAHSWLSAWTLDAMFAALIGALAAGQLFGAGWGLLALACFALAFPEPGAPRYLWLFALAALALARAAPPGRLAHAARALQLFATAALALVALSFVIQQARLALHPELELWQAPMQPYIAGMPTRESDEGFAASEATRLDLSGQSAADDAAVPAAPPAPLQTRERRQLQAQSAKVPGGEPQDFARFSQSKGNRLMDETPGQLRALQDIDPQARISTGPGVPDWSWRTVQISWSGPLRPDEQLRLWLAPPWLSRALGWLRAALVSVLFALLLLRAARGGGSARARAAAALLAALALGGAWPARAQLPSPEQLAELGRRLSQLPSCAPLCAESPHLALQLEPAQLRAQLRIDAAAATAVPLPGSLSTWSPSSVQVDGGQQPAALVRRPDGTLWLALEPGAHEVQLQGPLPERESVDLPLGLAPHRVEVQARGWSVSGVRTDGPTQALQLLRERAEGGAPERMEPGAALPGFAQVDRVLELGLDWSIRSSVQRLTPLGTPLAIEVPLLEGESVTSASVQVADGRALLRLGPQQSWLEWTSILQPREQLELVAGDSPRWRARWLLAAAPLWHVQTEGIPTTHEGPAPGLRTREWRPRPAERVLLRISRPAGAPGETLTIDASSLRATPGLRSTEAVLELSLRASRGQTHRLRLSPAAELVSAQIDGVSQPLQLLDGALELPVHPGAQQVQLRWREPRGAGWLYRAPAVDLGAPSVNARSSLDVPPSRWLWWSGGPLLGPAVLFWSLLGVLAALALALARSRLAPLGALSWFLLFVGLTQVSLPLGAAFAGWLLVLALRQRRAPAGARAYNAVQVALALWTLLALWVLFAAIQEGLLGSPEMQVSGNGSGAQQLHWYQDRAAGPLPEVWVFWLPTWIYRAAMLGWALWVASALLGWLRWGWSILCSGGLWRGPDAAGSSAS